MEILILTWLFLWTISFHSQNVVKNNRVLRRQIQCLIIITQTFDVCSMWIKRMTNAIMYLPLLGPICHRFASELQSNNRIVTHNRFLTCNTVPLKSKLPPSRETRIVSQETRLSSLETRLWSREARLLSRETRVSSCESVKNWKYGCLNFSWDFSSLMLTVQQQRSKTLRYLMKLRLRALAPRTVYHIHIKKL